MKLTPLEIRSKQFKHTSRGYLSAEVDAFLEELAEQFERLFGENVALAESCEATEQQLEQYRTLEQTLHNTLLVAKRSVAELAATAQKEAELTRSEATLEARQAVADAYPAQQALAKEIAVLQGVEEDLHFRLRSLLEGYARQLDDAEGRGAGAAAVTPVQAGRPADPPGPGGGSL